MTPINLTDRKLQSASVISIIRVPMSSITPGSLYLVAFAQANAPHVGMVIPMAEGKRGHLVHIRVPDEGEALGVWTLNFRKEPLTGPGAMACTNLLQIQDKEEGEISVSELHEAAKSTPVPSGREFGQCLNWAMDLVEELGKRNILKLKSRSDLQCEFDEFSRANRGYASRSKDPNVKISSYCS